MKRIFATSVLLALTAASADAKSYKEMFGHAPLGTPSENAIAETIDFKQGKIGLSAANATLNVPAGFYYLSAADTAKVLVSLWGNPPSSAEGSLGMFFPVKYAPDQSGNWGSVIEYSPDGYVSDVDAASTDYDALLLEMKKSTQEGNAERIKAGYEPITLVGWASPPLYDRSNHAVHWARDLIFGSGGDASHTLNYSVRILGREGVLAMNFISGIDQVNEIKAVIPATLDIVKFDEAKSYGAHADGDDIAAYSIAGLIAAGAGAKIAAKAGFLAFGLVFLKKFAIFGVLIAAAIGRFAMKLFGRSKNPTV